MKQTSGLLVLGATLLIVVGTLDGCATAERQQAAETEKFLAASGFQKRPFDSEGQQGANAVYTYADPQGCHCIYVGGAKEYARYRDFETSEAIARDMNRMGSFPLSWDWRAEDPLTH